MTSTSSNHGILDSFPEKARGFIKRTINVLKKHVPDDQFAIFVFGSLGHKQDHANVVNGTSDVDLLIILKDEVAGKSRLILKELETLQRHYFNNVGKKNGIIPSILHVVERQTGMHESIFLTREKDFKAVRFSSIFKTNKVLSRILAPSSIVFGSALCHVINVHGNKEIEASVKAMQSTIGKDEHILTDLIKSLLMNIVLSLGAALLLPFTKRATRYAVEAVKWSMYATTYLIIGQRPSKPSQKRFFSRLGISTRYLDRWFTLSRHFEPDTLFTLETVANVLRIHALGFKIKKIR